MRDELVRVAACKAEEMVEEEQARVKADEKARADAATKIQAVQRGKSACTSVKRMREERARVAACKAEEMVEEEQVRVKADEKARADAATKIQAVQRRNSSRKLRAKKIIWERTEQEFFAHCAAPTTGRPV